MNRASLLRQTLGHAVQYGAAGIISRAASVLLVPVYTRILVPADYGRLDLVLVFSSLVNLTIALEVSQGLARHFADSVSEAEKRAYASTSLWFSGAVYALFVAVTFAFAGSLSELILGESQPELMRVGAILIWSTGMFYLVQNQLRWKLDPRGYSVVSILSTVAGIVVSVVLVVIPRWGVAGIMVGQTVGMVMGLVVGLVQLRDVYGRTFDADRLKEMLRFSLPLVPSSVAVFVTLYIDRIVIAHFMTVADVGLFGIGYRIATLTSLVMIGFQTALTPLVYKHYRETETPSELAGIFRLFVAIALILCLGLALFADQLVMIFATPGFYGGADVVPFLAPAVLLAGMYVFAPGLAIEKRTSRIALINIVQAALGLGLNILLIPILGIQGAAIATLISAAAGFAAYMITSQRSYAVPHRWVPLGLAAAATTGLFVVTRPLVGSGAAEILGETGAIVIAAITFFRLGLIQPNVIRAAIWPRRSDGDSGVQVLTGS
jgi:O-antigen/teichoic acid export membrane protein